MLLVTSRPQYIPFHSAVSCPFLINFYKWHLNLMIAMNQTNMKITSNFIKDVRKRFYQRLTRQLYSESLYDKFLQQFCESFMELCSILHFRFNILECSTLDIVKQFKISMRKTLTMKKRLKKIRINI